LSVLSFRKKEEKKRGEEEKRRRGENPRTQAHGGKLSATRYQRSGSGDLKIRHPSRPGAPDVKVLSFKLAVVSLRKKEPSESSSG
jgi:hypothetical protein